MAIRRLSPVLLALLSVFPAQADELLGEMEAINVTATRSAKKLNELAPNTDVINRRQLNETLANDIKDAVRYEPGVDVSTDPSRRGNAGYTIRGIDGNRVLMLIDGLRLPEAYGGGGNGNGAVSGRDFVELESLQAIDIVKGPFSSLYGSDALGGVVGYRTKSINDILRPDASYGGSLKGFGATADRSLGGTLSLGARGAKADALVVYTYRDGHETENMGDNSTSNYLNNPSTSRTEPNPQHWHSNNILTKYGYNVDDNNRLELAYEYYERKTGTDVISARTFSRMGSVMDMTADDIVRRQRVSLGWDSKQLGAFDRLSIKLYYQDLDNSDDNIEYRTGNIRRLSDYGFQQSIYGATLDAEHDFSAWGAEHQLIWGIDVNRTDSSRPRDKVQINDSTGATTHFVAGELYPSKTFPDSTSDRIGLFVQDDIRFASGFTVSPGLRWDYYRMRAHSDQAYNNANLFNYPVSDFNDNAFSPKLGLSMPFADHYTGFFQISTGFRAPPFDDANMAFANSTYGYEVIPNPDLKSERSTGVEMGLKGSWQTFDFGMTAFYNRYRNFIENVTTSTVDTNGNGVAFESQYQNIGKVEISGFEARASWQFAPSWRLLGSLAYAYGENKSDSQPLDSVAPFTAVVGLRYDASQWGAEAFVRAVVKKDRVSQDNYFKVPSYGTLDLTAYWTPLPDLILRAGVFNVFDEKYWNAADVKGFTSSDPVLDRYTQPGRNFSASVEYKF